MRQTIHSQYTGLINNPIPKINVFSAQTSQRRTRFHILNVNVRFASTYVGDLRVGALCVLGIATELIEHTRLLLAAPHTVVLRVGELAEATVLPPHGAVVQGDWRRQKNS